MRPRRVLSAGVALLAMQLVAACGDTAEQDLCGQYDDLVSAVEELQAVDLMSAKAEQMRDQVEAVEAELDQVQAVSEGRLDSAISTLRASIDAIRQAALDSAGAEALETARSQLEEVRDELTEAWAAVQERMDVQCENA